MKKAFIFAAAVLAFSSCGGGRQEQVAVEDSLRISEVATLDEYAESPVMRRLDSLAESLVVGSEAEVREALASVQAELQAIKDKGDSVSLARYSSEVDSFLVKHAVELEGKRADTAAIMALLHGGAQQNDSLPGGAR